MGRSRICRVCDSKSYPVIRRAHGSVPTQTASTTNTESRNVLVARGSQGGSKCDRVLYTCSVQDSAPPEEQRAASASAFAIYAKNRARQEKKVGIVDWRIHCVKPPLPSPSESVPSCTTLRLKLDTVGNCPHTTVCGRALRRALILPTLC